MTIIERNRTIRPSSRQSASKYRVNLEKVERGDTVHINITHESMTFHETYTIEANDLKGRKNLYFSVTENNNDIKIIWQGDIVPHKV